MQRSALQNQPLKFCTYIKYFLCMAATLMFCTTGLSKNAFANKKYASIVIDADSGVVLHERHADKKRHPASLTKVMTLMLLFDAINEGRVGLRDRIKISRYAASMVPSKIGLPVGSSIRVKDAIYALVTKSANDVAVAMAEHLGGSEKNFAKMMTAKARSMGMRQTTFRNASGLHHPKQISTARDMAKMARALIHNYPRQYKYFSRQYFTYRGKTYRNHNRLLGKYKGMDGLKTGYIGASGFNLVASAVRGNNRIIGVVFGGRTTKTRNNHMVNLLDAGFEKMGSLKVAMFDNVPKPKKKPAILRAIASLNSIAPANGQERWANLNTSLQNGMFSKIVGEGDIDSAASKRIETGLIAIAAHKGDKRINFAQKSGLKAQPIRAVVPRNDNLWSIQIGAFASRGQTDKAINKAFKTLPQQLQSSRPIIVPMKKDNTWLFRGRLQGYTESQARAACRYLSDCIPIEPRS